MTRVFYIGFHRCGTTTALNYFADNGYNAVRWDGGRLAKRIVKNMAEGKPMIDGYRKFQFFAEMQHMTAREYLAPFKRFPTLVKENPRDLFVLNTRNVDDWLSSRRRYAREGGYFWKFKKFLNADEDAVLKFWFKEWNEHHIMVRAFFNRFPKFRFLELDIGRHGAAELNAKLPEFKLDQSFWGHANMSRNKIPVNMEALHV